MFSVEFDANIALSIWWFQAVTSLQTAMLAYSGTFLLPTSWGMPNIGRTETEAMLAGVGRNHPNDHFLQIPRVDNVARCYVCELVPGLKNAMLDFTGVFFCENYQHFIHSLGQKSKLVRNYMDFSMTEPPRFDLEWMAVLVVSCFFLNQP